jgi:hypothetical protein
VRLCCLCDVVAARNAFYCRRLVHFFSFLGAESLQYCTLMGDAGAISLGEGLKCNSSVKWLRLVSC